MKIPVTMMIAEVADAAVTADGHHVALTLREPSGGFLTLGVPGEAVPHLIDRAARALSDQGTDPAPQCRRRRTSFAATWWNLVRHEQARGFVLSLSFGTGGALSFVLTDDMAARLRDTLCCHIGSAA